MLLRHSVQIPDVRFGCAPWKGGAFQWVPLQPEATGAAMEVTKWLKPSISVSRIGDSASVQAVMRMNAEQASEKDDAQADSTPFRGRLLRLDEMSEVLHPDAAPG